MTTEATPSADTSVPEQRSQVRYFWERTASGTSPDGAALAALRRGVGREPGSVPSMWQHYTLLTADGGISARLRAEHAALTLYAIHQQSQPKSVHDAGIGVGKAVQMLRASEKFSVDAVDRRFNAAATATSLDECAYHLRGLVRQLRQISQPLDYTALLDDLIDWQRPERIGRVRRDWGRQYFLGRDRGGPDGTKPDRAKSARAKSDGTKPGGSATPND
ncbi:type I-E CRISPR-associated protein Cse2/CasB [Frankia sp. CiP3]|uniref:type I-E CRISPR-associated protein Cse2/CasB n=1 Tax=Frankia sp. CiP3 TaxID=2880971 RepID=UPI001EF69E3E|nr:type I-E CRISPR-associated protein Cse2/CasB [Frankia sp. CiP3]